MATTKTAQQMGNPGGHPAMNPTPMINQSSCSNRLGGGRGSAPSHPSSVTART